MGSCQPVKTNIKRFAGKMARGQDPILLRWIGCPNAQGDSVNGNATGQKTHRTGVRWATWISRGRDFSRQENSFTRSTVLSPAFQAGV